MKSSGNTMKAGKGPPAENKEKRRKKLNKRSRTVGPIKMKAMVHYTPTEEDISQLLKEFTVDFLLHGTL
jgi:timeless protein